MTHTRLEDKSDFIQLVVSQRQNAQLLAVFERFGLDGAHFIVVHFQLLQIRISFADIIFDGGNFVDVHVEMERVWWKPVWYECVGGAALHVRRVAAVHHVAVAIAGLGTILLSVLE